MENFGTLQVGSTLQFYDSLRRLLKLNKNPLKSLMVSVILIL